jgi:hypothetical protein
LEEAIAKMRNKIHGIVLAELVAFIKQSSIGEIKLLHLCFKLKDLAEK